MKKYTLLWPLLLGVACNSGEEITTTHLTEPVARVVEYTPAPGQFINEPLSGYNNVTTPEAACAYAMRRFSENDYVSLGGWGGYIVAAFAAPVPAMTEGFELYVKGNAMPTSSEPGVVWVMQDANGNGQPDDTWYELRGSEYALATHNYRITYRRPADNAPTTWTDGAGQSGTIDRMTEHTQPQYYPAWLGAEHTYEGVLLPENIDQGSVDGSQAWIARAFAWGYADNWSSIDATGTLNRFRIANATTTDGHPANLTQVDFIKVQTGVRSKAPNIGEVSTEVCGMGCYRIVTSR